MRGSIPKLLFALSALTILAGCNSSDGGAEPRDAMDASSDAPADAPDGGDADSDAGPPYHSFLMLERWIRADPPAQHTIGAVPLWFRDDRVPTFKWVDDHCGYHEGDWLAPDNVPPSFGPIHMDAPKLGNVAWTETLVSNVYEPPNGLGWDTGDLLKVVASGKDLPGFTLEDTVPAPVVLTSHELSQLKAGDLVIPRTQPFAVTWEPAQKEVFALFLQFDDASYIRYGVWCFFPASSGSAEVPVPMLGHLLPSSEVTNTNFYFSGASRKSVPLEGVDLEMVTWNGEAARVLVQ